MYLPSLAEVLTDPMLSLLVLLSLLKLATDPILSLLVLGISGQFLITDGTCLGEQFFLILDFIF